MYEKINYDNNEENDMEDGRRKKAQLKNHYQFFS